MSKKSTKKTLGVVLAVLLICVVSIAGTIAYLQDHTEVVTNTFTVGKLFEDGGEFVLKESNAVYNTDSCMYTLGNEEVNGNTYDKALPGVEIPKDPFVRITNLGVDSAYLFVEVTGLDKLSETTFSAEVSDDWTLTDLTPKQDGGAVYVYTANNGKITDDIDNLYILKDNKVTVAANCEEGSSLTLKFYGYMIQAGGFENYKKAWDAL